MKLIQVVHNTAGKIYIYECPVCGFSVMVHETDSGFVCPNCSEWAEDVAEEMEETNDRTDNNRMSPN